MFGYDESTKAVNSTHTVILGAGASIASYIFSGSIGKPLPSMAGLTTTLELEPEIKSFGLESWNDNFETFYSWLADSGQYPELQRTLETKISQYFKSLTLPNKPTIYDYLLLSLREKDVIATFNWDPFLIQAIRRNQRAAKGRVPKVYFLHGNVLAGYCEKCNIAGVSGQKCSKCKVIFTDSQLLFPVGQKNYNSNVFIKDSWNALKIALNESYLLTIFGYSAPKTDVEARKIMKEFWTGSKLNEYSEVEIIDIKPKNEVEINWEEFFFSHHYSVQSSIFESMPFIDPRRSCESFYSCTMMCNPAETNEFPHFETLDELHDWIKPLIEEEIAVETGGGAFSKFT